MTPRERMARVAKDRDAAGVCLKCGGARDDGCKACSGCRAKYRAAPSVAGSHLRKRRAAALVCFDGCGATVAEGGRCAECLAIHALKQRARYAERVAAGVCADGCGRKARAGVYCGIHARKRREVQAVA